MLVLWRFEVRSCRREQGSEDRRWLLESERSFPVVPLTNNTHIHGLLDPIKMESTITRAACICKSILLSETLRDLYKC